MMKDIHTEDLLARASEIDSMINDNKGIYQYVQKIIEEHDIVAIRTVLSKINILSESSTNELTCALQKLYQSLLLFLGKIYLSEINSGVSLDADEKTLEELQVELDDYVGLNNVKRTVKDLIVFHTVQKMRENESLKNTKSTLHMAFIGNPGTGKTSVARIIGRMYKQIGLLSKGHFIEVSRTDLIAGYQGQTALKVKKVIEKAKGGVLFIDEAYSITENSNSDSYGRECLTELTKALEDYRTDLVVIVAGYKEPMKQFFESNPGLKSRFNIFIDFEDYDENQLTCILENFCAIDDYDLTNALKQKAHAYFLQQVQNKAEVFANGRLVRNVYDNLTMNHAKRVIQYTSPSKKDLALLTEEDFIFNDPL